MAPAPTNAPFQNDLLNESFKPRSEVETCDFEIFAEVNPYYLTAFQKVRDKDIRFNLSLQSLGCFDEITTRSMSPIAYDTSSSTPSLRYRDVTLAFHSLALEFPEIFCKENSIWRRRRKQPHQHREPKPQQQEQQQQQQPPQENQDANGDETDNHHQYHPRIDTENKSWSQQPVTTVEATQRLRERIGLVSSMVGILDWELPGTITVHEHRDLVDGVEEIQQSLARLWKGIDREIVEEARRTHPSGYLKSKEKLVEKEKEEQCTPRRRNMRVKESLDKCVPN